MKLNSKSRISKIVQKITANNNKPLQMHYNRNR